MEYGKIEEQKKMNSNRRLVRSSQNKMLAGVCAGIANYFGVDPTVIRVAYALLSVCVAGFPGIVVYLILMIIMPEE